MNRKSWTTNPISVDAKKKKKERRKERRKKTENELSVLITHIYILSFVVAATPCKVS